MREKSTATFLAIGTVVLILAGVFWRVRQPSNSGSTKPRNILVVSACSVRQDRIGVFNPASKLTPKIDAWAEGAFVFENAIAKLPWENFGAISADKINPRYLMEQGYRGFRRPGRFRFLIPATQTGEGDEWYWSEKAILSYRDSVGELRKALRSLKASAKPAYVFAHVKYMHYPYYDDVNMTDEHWSKLSPRSRELMKTYVANPEKYPDKLPVIEVMLNSFSLLEKMFGLKTKVLSAAGIISDPARTAVWKKTPGFEDDVALTKELYDLKMTHFDDVLSEILNLFGDEELKKNTVVLFIGDHGEALMDHGILGHSVNVYEEMIRYPMVVKFPDGETLTKRLSGQINHEAMTDLVMKLIEGGVGPATFAEEAGKVSSDYVLSRNCNDTIQSVRFKSEWKFIKNADSGRDELYDLKNDPAERNNVLMEHAPMALQLEEYLIEHQSELHNMSPHERAIRVCL